MQRTSACGRLAPSVFAMNGALPVLYSFRRCPYAMRARLAMAVSGEPHELREVVLKNKPAEMLAASPKGTVPVLVLPDGSVIDQSLDVMLWALRRNDPENWLQAPQGSIDDMAALIAENDGEFKHHLDRYKYPNRYPEESAGDNTAFAQAHQAACARWLGRLEALLAGGWLFGTRASLADMAILPFVRQFTHTDAAWFATQPWPQLQAWLARFEASALYACVMGKHAPWQASAV
jgi:glutathione S-transferase